MNGEFEEFLEKKKPELRKMKDSDFTSTPVKVSKPVSIALEHAIESLTKSHQMDVMEVEAGILSYGIEKLNKLIQIKGSDYAKNLVEKIVEAGDKGDFKKVHELLDQMRKDINEDTINPKNGLSFEEFVKVNEERLAKEYESYKDEDFVVVKARNPENPEDIIELELHKRQIEKMKKLATEIGISMEELAFLTVQKTLESSENTPLEEKNRISEFLIRQIKRMEYNAKKDVQDTLENITLGQLKQKLMELHSISRRKLDMMEKSWRKEFKEKNLLEQFRNEDMYVKIKFASMLKLG